MPLSTSGHVICWGFIFKVFYTNFVIKGSLRSHRLLCIINSSLLLLSYLLLRRVSDWIILTLWSWCVIRNKWLPSGYLTFASSVVGFVCSRNSISGNSSIQSSYPLILSYSRIVTSFFTILRVLICRWSVSLPIPNTLHLLGILLIKEVILPHVPSVYEKYQRKNQSQECQTT